jgi:hypothetical protein
MLVLSTIAISKVWVHMESRKLELQPYGIICSFENRKEENMYVELQHMEAILFSFPSPLPPRGG